MQCRICPAGLEAPARAEQGTHLARRRSRQGQGMAVVATSTAMRSGWRQPSLLWMGLALILVVSVFTLTPVLFIIVNSLNSAPPSESWRFGFEGWREAFGSP